MSEPESRVGFLHGIAVGIAIAGAVAAVWLAIELAPMRHMYRDFGTALPSSTALIVSPAWLWGVPVAAFVAIGLLLARRPRARALYFATAALVIAVDVVTWERAQAPLREVAAMIKD